MAITSRLHERSIGVKERNRHPNDRKPTDGPFPSFRVVHGAAMLINSLRKFIFVHVQKNAGLSVEKALLAQFPDSHVWHGRHGRAIEGLREMDRAEWDGHFSFAFVRNPWDRMVSWYEMIDEARKKLSLLQRRCQKPFRSDLWNYAITHSHDFDSFLENCTETIFDLGCEKSFVFNQADYLTDDGGSIAVDFIGRFENIAADTGHVFAELGMGSTRLPNINRSHHSHYSRWYNAKSRQLVATRFARDIELFNYRFEQR
jgi:hypothetical protein